MVNSSPSQLVGKSILNQDVAVQSHTLRVRRRYGNDPLVFAILKHPVYEVRVTFFLCDIISHRDFQTALKSIREQLRWEELDAAPDADVLLHSENHEGLIMSAETWTTFLARLDLITVSLRGAYATFRMPAPYLTAVQNPHHRSRRRRPRRRRQSASLRPTKSIDLPRTKRLERDDPPRRCLGSIGLSALPVLERDLPPSSVPLLSMQAPSILLSASDHRHLSQ